MPRSSQCCLTLAAVALLCGSAAGSGSAQAQTGTIRPSTASRSIRRHVDATLRGGGVPAADSPDSPPAFHPSRALVRFNPRAPAAARRALHDVANARRVLAESRFVRGLVLVQVAAGGVAEALAAYRADPTVVYAEPDYAIEIADIPNDPEFDRLWGLQNTGQSVQGFFCFPMGTDRADIRAPEAWDIWTGDPDFRIAVIDTGVNYLHPDLQPNIWTNPGEIPDNSVDDDGNGWVDDVHGYDFHNQDPDPMDDHRHGSHVAGTIGAAGNNKLGVVGVNHQCSIVALKVFDANGRGFASSAVLAMEYAIANGIRVSNNSWGCSSADSECFSQALFDVIEASQDVGHVFVAAAGNDFGNDNDEVPYYPAAYDLPNILGVAATDNRDGLAIFSNVGATSVDLAAPGTCIYSTVLGSGYGYLDGTSMATPHVTGVVALVMSRLPELTWRQVHTRILETTRRVPAFGGITLTGGVVNAAAAVWDCNGNGVLDEQDIAEGTSDDCNDNALPDDCEPDCNGNGVADGCDILSGASDDCAGNGIPDECEPDCNRNGVADSCDIANGISSDCDGDGNGIPDECETDCDGNGTADSCDVARGVADCNRNGVPDTCEAGGREDCNDNNIADLCDIFIGNSRDCNHSGVPDECDVSSGLSEDCTGNDVPDECESDCNNNDIADSCDIADGTSVDCSNNRVPDECEPDCNGNNVADVCDIRDLISSDCNDNNIPDECEPGGTLEEDCNGNGRPDLCDIFDDVSRDCNSNAVPDACDIAGSTSKDVNEDGVPDECEGVGFSLVPVGASGPHTIEGNEIVLGQAGQTVTLELRVSGWDLDLDGDPRMRGYQAEIDASGFAGGLYGTLSLREIPCTTDEDCPGFTTECGETGLCPTAAAVFVDLANPNYAFFDLISVWLVNLVTYAPDFRLIGALFRSSDSIIDPGVEKYGATILLDVSPVAGGTFTVGFVTDHSVFGAQNSSLITVPSFTPALITIPSDCNDNGVLDDQDIAGGASADCNANGVPDECLHIEPDCNGNNLPDDCDIAVGRSEDCTGNGIPDECEDDCNGNGFADSCDLADGRSEDCTSDGIPDECEPDCNANGFADSCDVYEGRSSDINLNGIPDSCEPVQMIHVNTKNCLFPGAGTEDDPYCNIQFAIDNAGDGSQAIVEIVVEDGIYRGLGNKNLEFDGRALTLRSANGPANCTIDAQGSGRGMEFSSSDSAVYIDGFTIINGSADTGGAISCVSSSPTISNCVLRNNVALRFGGALYCSRSSPTIRNCVFSGNSAEFFNGGAVYLFRSSSEFSNCVIVNNRAGQGGAVYTSFGSPVFRNCTIAHNAAVSRGGGVYSSGSTGNGVLENSILWGDEAPTGRELYLSGARLAVGYSDVAGGEAGAAVVFGGALTWGEGNFDGHPRFVDEAAGDFHISQFSPCINSGDPNFMAQEGDRDMDGGQRVLLGVVDVGADEQEAFADCNGNGTPDGREALDGLGADCNENEVLDGCDLADGSSADELPAGGDGIPDECQSDCNGNGILDEQDIADGTSEDCDGNGVADECEVFGDVDENGIVDIFDIFCVLDGFVGVPTTCAAEKLDIGGCTSDGVIDLQDVMAVLDAFIGVDICCP